MIRQSAGINPKGIAIDPQPETPSSTESEGRWRRLGVVRAVVSTFIRSLDPFFNPPNSQPSITGVADSAAGSKPQGCDGQGSNLLQITTLAGRGISACAGMPPEINSMLSHLASLSVVGQFAWDQFNAFTARAGLLTEPVTQRENPPDDSLENKKDKNRKTAQNQRQQTSKSATTTLLAGPLINTPLALGALASLATVGASSASEPDTATWIEVADPESLSRICHDAESCSKKYRLTEDINGSQLTQPIGNVGKESLPFTGKLDGQGHTIGNLSHCLIANLTGNGHIDRLEFSDANITSKTPVGIAACEMSGDTIVSNIQVERSDLTTRDNYATAAIVVGKVNKGTVTNTTVANCKVETYGFKAYAGVGAGFNKGSVVNTHAENCRVKTFGSSAYAGIGAGLNQDQGTVTNTTAVNCKVKTSGLSAHASIGAGKNHNGNVADTTAVNCNVKTSEHSAVAGIGAGINIEGDITDTTAVNCRVKTSDRLAFAGIGVGLHGGKGTVTNTTAVNCRVKTSGKYAYAGIGVGLHRGKGTVTNTTAVNCHVDTGGIEAHAGIGAGYIFKKENIANTVVVNSTLESRGIGASALIDGGDKPVICNVSIDGNPMDDVKECGYWQNNDFCANINQRLLTPKCLTVKHDPGKSKGINPPLTTPITETMPTVPGGNMTGLPSVAITTPPTTVATVPRITSPGPSFATIATSPTTVATVPRITSPGPGSAIIATPPTTVATVPRITSPGPGSATIATPPTTVATVPRITSPGPGSATIATPPTTVATGPAMTFSSPVSATFATLTTLAASPNTSVIALGAVTFVLVGVLCVCTYCYCCQRTSTRASHNQPQTVPRDHHELLPIRHNNSATGGSTSMADTGEKPDPEQHPDSLVYEDILTVYKPDDSHYETMVSEQAGILTGGSNPMANTGTKPDQQGPDRSVSLVYEDILTVYKPDDSHYETMVPEQTGILTVGSNPMANTGTKPDQQGPDRPVYENIPTKCKFDYSHYETMVPEQTGILTGGSNPMANTGTKPDQQGPDRPVFENMPTRCKFDFSHYQPMQSKQAGMLTEGKPPPLANTEKKPD